MDSSERAGIVDLFAGPGGWDEGARMLGRTDVLGIELDPVACATAEAAGHARMNASVSELDPLTFAPVEGLIASPPCQAWSMAGAGAARKDQERIVGAAYGLARSGRLDRTDEALLVLEPLFWTLQLRPEWTAWEQVPPVLDLWHECAQILRGRGYHVWSGLLQAERYGVPQTRKRAFLIASRVRQAHPPIATHQRYVSGEPARLEHTFEGEILPWVSMADALGWGFDGQPSPTVSGGGGRDNGIGVFAGQAQRNRLRATVRDASERAAECGGEIDG